MPICLKSFSFYLLILFDFFFAVSLSLFLLDVLILWESCLFLNHSCMEHRAVSLEMECISLESTWIQLPISFPNLESKCILFSLPTSRIVFFSRYDFILLPMPFNLQFWYSTLHFHTFLCVCFFMLLSKYVLYSCLFVVLFIFFVVNWEWLKKT